MILVYIVLVYMKTLIVAIGVWVNDVGMLAKTRLPLEPVDRCVR